MAYYYYSRFRLNHDFSDYVEKATAIYDSLDGKFDIVYRRDNFKFVQVEYSKEGSGYYIIGRIVKYKIEQIEKVIDENNKVSDHIINNKILANSKFIISAETGIIIFEEVKSYIPKDTFPKLFEELFEKNSKTQLKITISPITEPNVFFNRIKEIKVIKRIEIKLVPSNPSSRDIWKKMDEKLHNDKITNYKEILENKNPGEGIIIDDETQSKFLMSEDGYGKSTVEGLDNKGDNIQVSTKDSNLHVRVFVSNAIDDLKDLIIHLKDKIHDIFLRTSKEENNEI